jgi:hypothetical protein
MTEPRISYSGYPDTSPEAEISVLAAIYKLAINCHARKEATRPGSPDAAKEIKNDSRPKHHSR